MLAGHPRWLASLFTFCQPAHTTRTTHHQDHATKKKRGTKRRKKRRKKKGKKEKKKWKKNEKKGKTKKRKNKRGKTKRGNKKEEKLLDWETANQIPWGLIILVGSGICLGAAISESGLSGIVAGLLTGINEIKTVFLILCIALLVTFLTEITSNTATTVILMPILGAASTASGVDPALLLIPAAISASCAFMLPVATMPNAVVYGSGKFTIKQMAKEGFVLNLIGALVVTTVCYLLLC